MKTAAMVSAFLCASVLMPCLGVAGEGDSASVVKSLDENNDRFAAALVNQDVEQFLSCWTEDGIFMIDKIPPICGQQALRMFFMDATSGLTTDSMVWLNRSAWSSGPLVYETGICGHLHTESGDRDKTTTYRPYLTVWSRQADGAWKRTASIWNELQAPSAEQLDHWRKQTPADMPLVDLGRETEGRGMDPDEALNQVAALEETLHDHFLEDDVNPAIDMYAEDARLLVGGMGWCDGREKIRDMILKSREHVVLAGIERDVLTMGGDGTTVYVANRFHWKFMLTTPDARVEDVFGKGLHVWRRSPDGKWELLIDVNNTSPTEGGSD